jgi:predicted RNase H-like HicB family nuclease
MSALKFIVEQHTDGFVAYPLGVRSVIVGQGDTSEAALADAKSALRFHRETLGDDALESDSPLIDAFLIDSGLDG